MRRSNGGDFASFVDQRLVFNYLKPRVRARVVSVRSYHARDACGLGENYEPWFYASDVVE